MGRNRAEGWRHAKLSGHSNEELIKDKINKDNKFKEQLSNRLELNSAIKLVSIGGINESNVDDVFGGKTKSKTDLRIHSESGESTNISIKKSSGGQVYLIGVERFLRGFEIQFNMKIPKNIERSIKLFFGGANDIAEIIDNIDLDEEISDTKKIKIKKYEKRKERITWKTLEKYNPELGENLIEWFRENIEEIFLFCFQRGLSKNKSDWAEYVWYNNQVGENLKDVIFSINELLAKLETDLFNKKILPGNIGGGTTIQLPFGFVQWHLGQIQFHHKQKLILEILNINN